MEPPSDPEPSRGSAGESLLGRSRPANDVLGYPVAFWIAFAANLGVVTANALSFRFAELVGFLGGRESTAGLIIGLATAAALASRLVLGQAIDRYGVRRLWLAAAVLFIAGGALLTVADSLSPILYVGRSLFAIGLAGVFTCSTVHVQSLVPAFRRTEVIGTLGSSGFLGMILGTTLGDLILAQLDGRFRFTVLFGASTLLGAAYLVTIHVLTRRDRHVAPAVSPAIHKLAVRHWPGNVMLVAFVMGLMLAVTTVFLTRFSTHRGLAGLGTFFAAYAGSAFTFRIVCRSWSRTVGRHRMILCGLAGHAAAMLLLPFATSEWLFAIPALFGGFGHALLFPAVISLGAEAFPAEYRGTGTTIVMGFFDVGTFVSAPLLGGIIDFYNGTGFTPMFLFAAAVALVVAVVYLLTTARTPDTDLLPHAVTASPLAVAALPKHRSPAEPFAPHDSLVRPSTTLPQAEPAPARGGVIAPATRCR